MYYKKLEEKPTTEFFTITTADNVEMDGWMVKPTNFDPNKKYPVVFYVYSEPARATVKDSYNTSRNSYILVIWLKMDTYTYHLTIEAHPLQKAANGENLFTEKLG